MAETAQRNASDAGAPQSDDLLRDLLAAARTIGPGA